MYSFQCRSKFAHTPTLERYATYGGNVLEEAPVQAFRRSLDKLNEQLAEFGIKPSAVILPCPSCVDLDEVEGECPGDFYKGKELVCGECEATYYEEWGGRHYATNEPAHKNHPELKTL